MKNKPDKYDRAIAWLKRHPDKISEAWAVPLHNIPEPSDKAHCLFQYATKDGRCDHVLKHGRCGCLTTIRGGTNWVAQTKKLTNQIKLDARIPNLINDVTVADLPVFAEWQRRLDKELKRKP